MFHRELGQRASSGTVARRTWNVAPDCPDSERDFSRLGEPAAALIAGVAVVGLSGCSSDDSSDTTTTTEKSSDSSSSTNFEVSTPEGQVSLSLDGELPPGLPEDFPLPEDADTAGSGSLGDFSSGVMVGVSTTKESGKDAFDFYAGESSLEPSSESSAGGEFPSRLVKEQSSNRGAWREGPNDSYEGPGLLMGRGLS